jgi:DNA-binding transcriptional MerR regulator
MIMTNNRGLKAAIRRRMAETGESYVVARRAVLADAEGPGVPGARADELTPEQRYVREATAAGVSADEIDAALEAFRQADLRQADLRQSDRGEPGDAFGRAGREQASTIAEQLAAAAERLAEAAEQAQQAAERAREQADQAEEAANEAEEQAVAAEERADLAADAAEEAANDETGWAEAEGRAGFWPGGRDAGAVWAEATRSESGADAPEREWGGAPPPPVPPAPPVPPVPPVPPAPHRAH